MGQPLECSNFWESIGLHVEPIEAVDVCVVEDKRCDKRGILYLVVESLTSQLEGDRALDNLEVTYLPTTTSPILALL